MGVLLGAYIGLILGRLPGFFSTRLLIRDVRWKTTTELQAILQVNQFYFFQLAIAELAVRGEDIQKERSYVLELLVSDNYAARVCAWQTLRYFFPDAAKQIVEYQPKDSLDICRIKTRGLAEMT